MSSPAPKSPPEQSDKSKKYDRQLRLWGDHGQKLLENSKVCLINATALGTEILKSLVLPGIGSFTIVDGEKVTEEDIGSNFFLETDSVGSARAQVATQCLLELNPDVRGDYIDESAEHIISNTQNFFKNFDVVIATALPEKNTAIMALSRVTKPKVFYQLARSFSSATNLVGVEVDNKSGVATVTFQRPPVNSLNLEILTEIKQTLTDLENNKCRGAIITSAFKTFSAGLDIMEMYRPDVDRARKWWVTLQDVYEALYGSPYPTVAVINGPAPAGGCLLAMCTEYRVMVPKSIIGLNETLLGIVAPPWFARTMENIIGKRQTELALTTGRLFSTEEALAVGLIDEIVQSKEEGIVRAQAFLSKFAKISPLARNLTKQIVRGEALAKMSKGRQQDLELFLQSIQQEAIQKGLGMYIEALKKRSAS